MCGIPKIKWALKHYVKYVCILTKHLSKKKVSKTRKYTMEYMKCGEEWNLRKLNPLT